MASPVCFAISYFSGVTDVSAPTLFWGVVQGVCFIGTYYLLCSSMTVSGLAITTAILRLAVVIPVAASIAFWGELPSVFQVVGIVACLSALPLIGLQTKVKEGEARAPITSGAIFVMVLLFVGMGIANLSSKAFVESGVPDARTTFVGVLFGVAGICGLFVFLLPAWRENVSGVTDGVQLGLVNVASITTHVMALEQVDGIIAFPIQAAGGMTLNTLFAAWIWGERFAGKTIIGMAIAVIGLVLINLA